MHVRRTVLQGRTATTTEPGLVCRLGARILVAMLLATGLLAFGSLTQSASAEPMCDVPDPPPICDGPGDVEPEPDPDPGNGPVVAIDVARQTTDRSAVRVSGWTADIDSPLTALTVRITVDGVQAHAMTASGSRPDVAAAYPHYGAAHGYDVIVPASATAQQVCVIAVNVGSGTDQSQCRQIDDIVEFEGGAISYDTANAVIASTNLDELDKVTNTNKTTVEQSTTISGSRALTDTQSWSSTFGLKVTVSGGVKIPLITDFKVQVEGSTSFTNNGSSSTNRTFSWSQPVKVPAKSKVVATVAVTRSELMVPYSMSGNYVYRSGHRAPGSISGTYRGINSHDLEVTLTQYNLDGTPAARAAEQPEPELSER